MPEITPSRGPAGPTFNGGAITTDLVVDQPVGDVSSGIIVNKAVGTGNGIEVNTPLAQTGGTCFHLAGDNGLTELAYFGGGNIGYMYWTADNAAPVIVCNAAPVDGQVDTSGVALWFDDTNGAAALMLKAKQADGTVKTGRVTVALPVSGALPTVQLASTTGAQILTTRDAETITPVTFNSGVANTATCLVALSPDNVTYSALGTETEPVGVALAGTIHLVKVRVPAGWYLRLTVTNATLGLTTYY